MNRFIVDAETDGLYGRFLSVAAMVTDWNGQEIDRFYGAVAIAKDEITSEWVKENVYPYLGGVDRMFSDETELLEAFWQFWMKHRESAMCFADVCYPVETRLFMRCVMRNEGERQFLGPFPLYDLSSILLAAGIDPDIDRTALATIPLTRHDAMNDVLMTADILNRYLRELPLPEK